MKTTNTKKGLVLGGGGSRGSYTMGVLSALGKQNFSYDIVTGISIGALVGAIYAQQNYDGVEAWIRSFTSQDVALNLFNFPDMQQKITLPAPSPNSSGQAGQAENQSESKGQFASFVNAFQYNGPSVEPLKTMYSEIFNYDEFQASPIEFACLAADLTDNCPKIFTKQDMTRENAIDCLLASAAYFPAFSFKEIDGHLYGDGGYLNSTLGEHAEAMGADSLTIVSLADPGLDVPYVKEKCSLMVRPILKLAYFLNFEKPVLLRQIMQGRMEAMKYMEIVPGYIYTFYEEDWLLLDTFNTAASAVIEKNKIHYTNEMIIKGMTELLGYRPGELNNRYMKEPQACLILECLGLAAGVDPYQQYHLLDFLNKIITSLSTFQIHLSQAPACHLYSDMETAGIRDLLVFFHSALQTWNGVLPAQFDILRFKFGALYDLALAWHILDHFKDLLHLF